MPAPPPPSLLAHLRLGLLLPCLRGQQGRGCSEPQLQQRAEEEQGSTALLPTRYDSLVAARSGDPGFWCEWSLELLLAAGGSSGPGAAATAFALGLAQPAVTGCTVSVR